MRKREAAKTAGDFSTADSIRLQLTAEHGVKVVDQKGGPSGWKFLDGSTNKIDPKYSKVVVAPPKPTASEIVKAKDISKSSKVSESSSSKVKETIKDTSSSKAVEKVSTKRKETEVSAKEASPAPKKAKVAAVLPASELARNQQAIEKVVQPNTVSKGGIIIEDLQVGKGPVAEHGDKVKVHYVGKLKSNNKVFDSSTKKPFAFRLGKGEVIKGWDIGVAGTHHYLLIITISLLSYDLCAKV